MDTPPDHPSDKDPLFDQIEEWRADFDEEWFDRFARCVGFAFLGAAVALALVTILR